MRVLNEGGAVHRVQGRSDGGLEYKVELPGAEWQPEPLRVEALVGGLRHGVSFFVRPAMVGGFALDRAPLVESRFLHSAKVDGLALSPGFPKERPATFETAFGRVLSPSFERKCLGCHVSPAQSVSGRGGVDCEACHGAGESHVKAAGKIDRGSRMETCAPCHSGFGELVDHHPGDVLISNQVNAIKNTECWVQSGGAFSCTSCHDPHGDAAAGAAAYEKACLGCHGATVKQAAVCGVSAGDGCVGCHMKKVRRGPFDLVDHWIRVHPGTGKAKAARSSVVPRRVFLRIIAASSAGAASEARERLSAGEAFFEVARKYSSDASAGAGGYLGEMVPSEMDSRIAEAVRRLDWGEVSPVLDLGTRWLILRREPRDFRWQAEALVEEGVAFKEKARVGEALAKFEAALRLNPRMLRALTLYGAAIGETGNAGRAVAILEQAAILHPKDPAVHYNLGIAYGAAGRLGDEIGAYRRALDLEPDLVPAYQNLGAALLKGGEVNAAMETFRRGLVVNPLAATLHYNLGVALQGAGQAEEAKRRFGLAAAIDGRFRRGGQ
ncbi:MAG: peptidylprolyl isomerase [Bryobacteraceae bacterium]|nr:peptidylprolyl isomerase [Bryobacteraceae bacterium]